MPFYEYECPSCRHVAEVMQKISDAPLKKCPACGKSGIRRLISAPVFRLKGSGWYETDFKSDKEGKRNLAGGDKDDTKPAEAKPDAGAGTGTATTSATATPAATPAASSEPTKADKPASARRPAGKEPKAKARPVKAAPARRASSAKAPARRK
jgi:putative FmdB family regulatory protein